MEKLVLGSVRTNCYFVINEETNEVIIVDPASNSEQIQAFVEQRSLMPVGILLTHGHFDHIFAVDAIRKLYDIRVYAHENEQAVLANADINLSSVFGAPFTTAADVLLEDGSVFEMAGAMIEVMLTPGHTAGSVCYYIAKEDILFSGDTLFQESYGRTDFPTGSFKELEHSIKERLFMLPCNTIVYPGHEDITHIGHEKQCNPIL